MNLHSSLDGLDEGILIINLEGNIVYSNRAYADFIGEKSEDILGKALLDIRPGAIAPSVLKTGQAVQSRLRKEYEEEYFANIYPIKENDKVVGCISVVIFLKHAKIISDELSKLKSKEYKLYETMKLTNGTKYNFDSIVAESEKSIFTKNLAIKVSTSDVPILLQAESGCGKELYAQAIHNESERREYPFVAINCAALNTNMLESELFGYAPGAFTGAKKEGKIGLFEIAENGTIFLDEISEMDYNLQSKLLRVLQEKQVRRIGDTKERSINVRVICACNVDLQQYVYEKRFRKDLYYRVAVMSVTIEPLRERREDILPLVEKMLKDISINKKKQYRVSEKVIDIFKSYDWPGNIRELRNILEYACLMSSESVITKDSLPHNLTNVKLSNVNYEENTDTLATKMKKYEKQVIEATIDKYGNDLEAKKIAARELGISLATLYNKIK